MARAHRIQAEQATYHVMARGNNRQPVFLDATDRYAFIRHLDSVVLHRRWVHLAFVLMGNHFHAVLRTEQANLADGMRDLLSGYARRFNTRHARAGCVFSDRYYSVVVRSDTQLLATLRYVAWNPVRADLAETPTGWKWGSASALLGARSLSLSLDCDATLDLLHPHPERARLVFKGLIETPAVMPAPSDLTGWPPDHRSRPRIAALVAVLGLERGIVAARGLGYRNADIAAALHLTRSAVSKRLGRAKGLSLSR